jgi:hydroxycarboxylate dehydrogenase B
MPRIFSPDAHKLVVDIFSACGASLEETHLIANHLVEANLRGVDSHGLIRVPQYVQDVRAGVIRPGAPVAVVHETSVSAVVDCGWNFGLVGAEKTAEIALQKAQANKMAVIVTRRCNHAGRLGHYLEKIARADFWGLGFCSSPRHGHFVVPWGGRDGRLATNPFAYAIPMPDRPPIVADFSTSQAPEGKIRLYKDRKQKLPEGWIVDAGGQPSTSPGDFYGPPQGGILPFGGALGYRGYSLGLLVELMATILAGESSVESRPGNGVTFLLFHPTLLVSPKVSANNLIELANYIKSSRPNKEGRDVLLPGEPEQQTRAKRLRDGIEIEPATWSAILAVAASLNVNIELEERPSSKTP